VGVVPGQDIVSNQQKKGAKRNLQLSRGAVDKNYLPYRTYIPFMTGTDPQSRLISSTFSQLWSKQ